MACSAEGDSTYSAVVGVSCSAIIGLAVCSIVCSTIDCLDYYALGGVRVIMAWIDDEESLLKMLVWRPQRLFSSSESSSSIITGGEGAGMADCIGMVG